MTNEEIEATLNTILDNAPDPECLIGSTEIEAMRTALFSLVSQAYEEAAQKVRAAANHLSTIGDVDSYDVASKFFESTDPRVLDLKYELEQYAARQISKAEPPIRALKDSLAPETVST